VSEVENGAHPEAVPRWVAGTAVAGTIAIAIGAFWLSFTALADLARRSGIGNSQAWAWPLIVDGIIVVATISVVALHEHGAQATRYPWTLLIAGAAVSVAANAVDAVVSADAVVPPALAASVSAVPPLVLLAITHLTVELARRSRRRPMGAAADGPGSRREAAARLRAAGRSYRQIAESLGIHPSTVGRWLEPERRPTPSSDDADGVAHLSGKEEAHA
jgi:DNA-binding transcriptional ArsR family regulator